MRYPAESRSKARFAERLLRRAKAGLSRRATTEKCAGALPVASAGRIRCFDGDPSLRWAEFSTRQRVRMKDEMSDMLQLVGSKLWKNSNWKGWVTWLVELLGSINRQAEAYRTFHPSSLFSGLIFDVRIH
jgi:hypothetical protein